MRNLLSASFFGSKDYITINKTEDMIIMNIDEIMEMLDWNQPTEVQEKAREAWGKGSLL